MPRDCQLPGEYQKKHDLLLPRRCFDKLSMTKQPLRGDSLRKLHLLMFAAVKELPHPSRNKSGTGSLSTSGKGGRGVLSEDLQSHSAKTPFTHVRCGESTPSTLPGPQVERGTA
jgi:hypothetical protein